PTSQGIPPQALDTQQRRRLSLPHLLLGGCPILASNLGFDGCPFLPLVGVQFCDPSLRVRAIAVSAVLSGLAAPPGAADAAGAHVVEEVVVTASVTETPRRQIGTAVSVISGPEIELRGYHSLADVLRTQPGIGVSNSGGRGHSTALRIRGEEAFRT